MLEAPEAGARTWYDPIVGFFRAIGAAIATKFWSIVGAIRHFFSGFGKKDTIVVQGADRPAEEDALSGATSSAALNAVAPPVANAAAEEEASHSELEVAATEEETVHPAAAFADAFVEACKVKASIDANCRVKALVGMDFDFLLTTFLSEAALSGSYGGAYRDAIVGMNLPSYQENVADRPLLDAHVDLIFGAVFDGACGGYKSDHKQAMHNIKGLSIFLERLINAGIGCMIFAQKASVARSVLEKAGLSSELLQNLEFVSKKDCKVKGRDVSERSSCTIRCPVDYLADRAGGRLPFFLGNSRCLAQSKRSLSTGKKAYLVKVGGDPKVINKMYTLKGVFEGTCFWQDQDEQAKILDAIKNFDFIKRVGSENPDAWDGFDDDLEGGGGGAPAQSSFL